MNQNKDTRWQQRFEEFQKALRQLEKALSIASPDEIYRAGIIQIFEFTFELGWKTLKDYLNAQGYLVKSPRHTIQQAFQDDIIKNGHDWIDALNKRNLMAHTYDEKNSIKAEKLIRDHYYHFLKELEAILQKNYEN